MKKSLFLFVLVMVTAITLTAQVNFNASQNGSQKVVFPKQVKNLYRVAGDTVWVSDSVYYYNVYYGTSAFAYRKYIVNTHNNMGLNVCGVTMNLDDNGHWFLSGKDSIAYYDDTIVNDRFNWEYDNSLSQWKITLHNSYTRDGLPLLLEQRNYDLQMHRYKSGLKRIYVYDSDGVLSEFYSQDFDTLNGNFVDHTRNYYYYNVYGYDSLMTSDQWDVNLQQWIKRVKIEGEYNPLTKKLVSTTYKSQDNGESWQPDVKYIYHYIQNDNFDTLVYAQWQPDYNLWLNKSRNTYLYDEYGRNIESIYEEYIFADSSWEYSGRSTTTYDNNGEITETAHYKWDAGTNDWKLQYKDVFVYNNDLITEAYYISVPDYDSVPDTSLLVLYYYDNHFNLDHLDLEHKIDGEFEVFNRFKYYWSPFVPNSVSENFENSVYVFPNPSNGILNITNPFGSVKPYFVEIYDLNGRKVHGESCSTNTLQINLGNQPKGIYLLKLESGTKSYMSKIILK
jgi:hypothetical protein